MTCFQNGGHTDVLKTENL